MAATPDVLTTEQVQQLLSDTADGTKISVVYSNVHDPTTIRRARGTLFRSAPTWVLALTTTSRMRIPSPNARIHAINILPASSRGPSRDRPEVEAMDLGAFDAITVVDDQQAVTQRPLSQPLPQYEAQRMMMDFMERQQQQQLEQQKLQSAQMERMINLLAVRAAAPPAPQADAPARKILPGADISGMIQLGDALRGTDSPQWRLAPGLLLPRYIPERFKIVSIPHLLFAEDPSTMEMVKLPAGTALQKYIAMRGDLKHQFPNQVQIRQPVSQQTKRDGNQTALVATHDAGVRAQLERCEQMFADLLSVLDRLRSEDDLPTTKEGWRMFIDAGVAVLECYSTLANGFIKGGAKVAIAHSAAFNQGKFDPAKLWQNEVGNDSFRL